MDIKYTWIYGQGKFCRQIRLLIWISFIDQFVHPVGGQGIGCNVILASCGYQFIRVHKNLEQHPSNTISITITTYSPPPRLSKIQNCTQG